MSTGDGVCQVPETVPLEFDGWRDECGSGDEPHVSRLSQHYSPLHIRLSGDLCSHTGEFSFPRTALFRHLSFGRAEVVSVARNLRNNKILLTLYYLYICCAFIIVRHTYICIY